MKKSGGATVPYPSPSLLFQIFELKYTLNKFLRNKSPPPIISTFTAVSVKCSKRETKGGIISLLVAKLVKIERSVSRNLRKVEA